MGVISVKQSSAPQRSVTAVGVIVSGLLVWVEPSASARVCAAATQVQPIALVAVNIKVNQVRFKPGGTCAPIAAQVMDQIAGQVLAHAVGQVGRGGELAHAGVDEGVSGFSGAPSFEIFR